VQRFPFVPVAGAAVLAIAGCGSGTRRESTAAGTSSTPVTAPGTPSAAGVQISTKALAGLGTVLVNGHGQALYLFLPDKHTRVTCVSTCAQVWPPVKLAGGQRPVASGKANPSLLGSDPDPEGGKVLTYAGWPLYTYIADSSPGSASGQGLNTNGGQWYVLSPSGQAVTRTP
jgi:predicted lipoprotein with Yx(FWY)xxD motif